MAKTTGVQSPPPDGQRRWTKGEHFMSNGFRLRAILSGAAVATASLALAASAGASSGGSIEIQARDACDPATFPAGLCARPDNSGPTVTFDALIGDLQAKSAAGVSLADMQKRGDTGQWNFTRPKVKAKVGQSVFAVAGRGGEVHTFTDVTATGFGPGCIDVINAILFGSPAVADVCNEIDQQAGVPAVFIRDGLFPGRVIPVDTSTPGVRLFQCMLHPWMQTTVTVS
jgi:hypothetical protein